MNSDWVRARHGLLAVDVTRGADFQPAQIGGQVENLPHETKGRDSRQSTSWVKPSFGGAAAWAHDARCATEPPSRQVLDALHAVPICLANEVDRLLSL